jgi:hypothetical protein
MSTPTISREAFLSTYLTLTTPPSSDPECSICKEEYDDTTHAAVTFSQEGSCGHVFGQHCIEAWLNEERVNTCAMCRREMFCLPAEEQWEDYEYEYDDDDDDEEEEEVYLISEDEISTLLVGMWERICSAQWHGSYSLPIPARSLTRTFMERLSMDACGGLVDLQDMLRHDQLRRLDIFFGEMSRNFVGSYLRVGGEENEGERILPFPEARKTLWTRIVNEILEIETPDQHLAALQLNMTDSVVTQIVEGTWLSVELAIAAQQSTGDMSLVELLPGNALIRVLYYAGTYPRKAVECYLNERRWETLCLMLEEMRFLQQELNLNIQPEGRKRYSETMRWIFMLGELEEGEESSGTDDEDGSQLDSVAGWEAECEEIT